MGNGNSIDHSAYPITKPYHDDSYTSISYRRSSDEAESILIEESEKGICHKLYQSEFSGVWSVHIPERIGPVPRTGHFSVFCPDIQKLIIGYGMKENGDNLNDFWALDIQKKEWENIQTKGKLSSPRTGAKAVYYKGSIIIFGGYNAHAYFSDLHILDLCKKTINMVATQGCSPSPRSSPIMEVVCDKLIVWGGFNGNWLNDLCILDLNSFVWTIQTTDITGRVNIPSIVYQNSIYAYGGSKTGGFISINPEKGNINQIESIGASPSTLIMGAGMVLIGNHAFFFGGKSENSTKLVYCCNMERFWWFVFHIVPDGKTVSLEDGSVNTLGLFLLPDFHNFSAIYSNENREIVAVLGEPHEDPPVINIIKISEAMAHINLREDMLKALI